MKIIDGKKKSEIIAVNDQNEVLGKGYIFEFMASDLFDKRRVNYFIETEIETLENQLAVKDFIVDELVAKAKEQRKMHATFDARVYHCCFADNTEEITYYSQRKGFNKDEGMHILAHNLQDISKVSDIAFEVIENNLDTTGSVDEFIEMHSNVFIGHPYDIQAIDELKKKKGYKSIGIYDQGKLVANIILFIEEEAGREYGWVEDMVVSKSHRKIGLGKHLVLLGLSYFKDMGIKESRLEVWNANERASKLYYKLGYNFIEESEVSIGMMI